MRTLGLNDEAVLAATCFHTRKIELNVLSSKITYNNYGDAPVLYSASRPSF